MVGLPSIPEGVDWLGVAQVVGPELQHRFAGSSEPELLGAFDATTDQLDRGFDMAAGNWQAFAAILRIVHVAGVVSEIHKCTVETLSGIVTCSIAGRLAKACLVVCHFGDDLFNVALPNQLSPRGIEVATNCLGCAP